VRALALLLLVVVPASRAEVPDGGVAKRPIRTLSDVKLLYFHASWCSSCKAFEATKVLERLDPALVVEPVDVDVSEAQVTRYGVTHTPTLVLVDREGFPLGKPSIDLKDGELKDGEATLARVQKLVKKMTGPR
jgi:thiol-disulfide isomerase/thioredoxin